MAMMKSFASFFSPSWDGRPCLPQNVTCTFEDPPPELDVGPYFIMDSAKGNTAIPDRTVWSGTVLAIYV